MLYDIINELSDLYNPVLHFQFEPYPISGVEFIYPSATVCDRVVSSLPLDLFEDSIARIDDYKFVVSHSHLSNFLKRLGAPNQVDQALELFYLEHNQNRASWLAMESFQSTNALLMPDEFLSLHNISKGPRPNQLIADLTLNIPEHIGLISSPHIVFLLDCSGSMNNDDRFTLLKTTVLNSINQLPSYTRVSVYFYNKRVTTIFENKVAHTINEEDREDISDMDATGSTNVTIAIATIITNLWEDNEYDTNVDDFNIVWLTDGDDDAIDSNEELIDVFNDIGCYTIPRLITVGIKASNEPLLNSVAEDSRFKAPTMVSINSFPDTSKLYPVLASSIGLGLRRVIIATQVDNNTDYEDLDVINIQQDKSLCIQFPLPSGVERNITFSLIVNNDIFLRIENLPNTLNHNSGLLEKYFKQVINNINLIKASKPEKAKNMWQEAINSIPSMTNDPQLALIRRELLTMEPQYPLFQSDLNFSSTPTVGITNSSHTFLAQRPQQAISDAAINTAASSPFTHSLG